MNLRETVCLHSLNIYCGPFNACSTAYPAGYKPNSITLASSELAPNMFGASSELATVMEFGFNRKLVAEFGSLKAKIMKLSTAALFSMCP